MCWHIAVCVLKYFSTCQKLCCKDFMKPCQKQESIRFVSGLTGACGGGGGGFTSQNQSQRTYK